MIEIPANLVGNLGPEMKMDVHWIDVKLQSGARFNNLLVRGGRYITGKATDSSGEGPLPFTGQDIAAIRRHRAIAWPYW